MLPHGSEVNTNAGGLATVFTFSKLDFAQKAVRRDFISAIKKEFELFQRWKRPNSDPEPLRSVAIVDDDVTSQVSHPHLRPHPHSSLTLTLALT